MITMTDGKPIAFSSGIFTLSLDFELIWGTLDKPKWRRFQHLCQVEREVVIDRLLSLFAEYQVSATWCTVGHLFLDRCNHEAGQAGFPSAPGTPAALRLKRDPSGSETSHPVFYGRQLINRIRACSTPQEIGSHTFTHLIVDDPHTTREMVKAELKASEQVANDLGVTMTSFAFPRNRIGHLDLLPRHGYSAFRGQDMTWHERTGKRTWMHKAGHLCEIFCAAEPPTVTPEWRHEGIWEIPGSMLFTPSYGLRRYVPVNLRVRRAMKGLDAAVRSKKIFHLWFHPTDLVVRHDAMLEGLRRILEYADRLRSEGKLEVLPMRNVVEKLEEGRAQPGVLTGVHYA